jgi:predicted nucleic acid-binding protein
MNLATWECAANIYAESCRIGKSAGDSDILIAAFSIVGGYTLVTNNTRHFEHIKNLQIADWSTM